MQSKRIIIDDNRAIELYNLSNNTRISNCDELNNKFGRGRCTSTIRVLDLNENEKKQLEGANFFSDSMKHPPEFPDNCCLLGMIKESNPYIFWIGEC